MLAKYLFFLSSRQRVICSSSRTRSLRFLFWFQIVFWKSGLNMKIFDFI